MASVTGAKIIGTAALLLLVAGTTGCVPSSAPQGQDPAIYTTWGVKPEQLQGNGLLINGLTPINPSEHH